MKWLLAVAVVAAASLLSVRARPGPGRAVDRRRPAWVAPVLAGAAALAWILALVAIARAI